MENILGNHRFKKITTPRSHNDVFWSKTYIPKKLLDPKKFVNHLTQEAFKLVRSKGYIKGLDNNTYLIQTVGPRSYITEVLEEKKVYVEMTLTSPNCPVAESLPNNVKDNILKLDGVNDVDLKLVWDPPWTKDKMSEAAKLELNL